MLNRLDLRGSLARRGAERSMQLRQELPRPSMVGEPPTAVVQTIIDQVREGGDHALRELTSRFDHVDIEDFRVTSVEIDEALHNLAPLVREALVEAQRSILAFHRFTKPENGVYERDGINVREVWAPVDAAGCYVPGGRAVYPSSVLMSAIPARVAGVERVVLCVPPGPDGTVPQVVLAAAALAEVDEVYCVGGAQAIAALAYGTESIAPVDAIVGPGNIYVATAKQLVSGAVGVPSSFAGPSEIVVIADESTPAELAAVDLVVQAEHGPDGLSWLITTSEAAADAIDAAVARVAAESPRRSEIESTLGEGGYVVLVDDSEAAMDVANAIAPEHLQLMSADAEDLVPLVRHAGAVFVGSNAPASVGDYMAGPSHVLPVYGSARFASALSVFDFLRNQHIISLDESTLNRIAPHVAALADAEGLDTHARSVRLRTQA